MVICDSIYHDRSTGKAALVGVFSGVNALKFPALHPQMWVYVSVTEARAKARFRLDVVNSESDQQIVSVDGEVPREVTPVHVCDMTFQLDGLLFPSAGLYYVRFWMGERLLLQRPLMLHLLKMQPGTGEAEENEYRNGEHETLELADKLIREEPTTTNAAEVIHLSNAAPEEPTSMQRMRIIELSGSLDFWNRAEEDIYTLEDGESVQ